jgi:hypothetical protein
MWEEGLKVRIDQCRGWLISCMLIGGKGKYMAFCNFDHFTYFWTKVKIGKFIENNDKDWIWWGYLDHFKKKKKIMNVPYIGCKCTVFVAVVFEL